MITHFLLLSLRNVVADNKGVNLSHRLPLIT